MSNQHTQLMLDETDGSFKTLFYLSPIGMAISTMNDGQFIKVNDAYCDITGYTRAQLLEKSSLALKLLSSRDREIILENVKRAGFIKNMDVNLLSSSGDIKVVATSIHHTLFNGQKCLITTIMDVTERKRLEDELRYLAQTDVLSGLANRRYFIQQAETEISRCIRTQGNLSIIIMDIDHFKDINDTYGHQVGDLVIHELGRLCQITFRQIDILGRIGGEEFAIILPLCSISSALQVAERMRHAAASAHIPLEQKNAILHFTVSMGITEFLNPQTNLAMLMEQADTALYEAKNSGRNCISIFTAH